MTLCHQNENTSIEAWNNQPLDFVVFAIPVNKAANANLDWC